MLIKVKNEKDFGRAKQLLELAGIECQENVYPYYEFCNAEAPHKLDQFELDSKVDLPDELYSKMIDGIAYEFGESEIVDNELLNELTYDVVERILKENGMTIEQLKEEKKYENLISDLEFGCGNIGTFEGNDGESISVHILQDIEKDHQLHYWLCGPIVDIMYKNYVLSVVASGEVRARLFDEEDTDAELVYTHDKRMDGKFYSEMFDYINDDQDLLELLEQERLVFDNNNWFELFITLPNGDEVSESFVMDDSETVTDAICSVIATADDMVANEEQYLVNGRGRLVLP